MTASLRGLHSLFVKYFSHSTAHRSWRLNILALLPLLASVASAQTSISGTVYMPNGTNVLPNVLVYLTTGIPASLVSGAVCPGANCLTSANAVPDGVTNYTYTAVDGTFTLNNVPENADYTVVIQAGHWRRQFTETVGTSSLTGLSLSMPSTHAQGDIPLVAINTGSADAVECVFRDMGVSSNEVTDDTVTSGATLGGRIHLYKGIHKPGAVVTSSTPSESALMGGTSTTALNSYDMVMFPCQGESASESTSNIDQLIAYTSAGGRVFLTHYSKSWLDNDDTYNGNSLSGAASWLSSAVSTLNPDPGVGTVNASFTRGATLSQWLYNGGYSNGNTSGAADTGTQGQVQISTLRWDVSSINDPAQSWLTLNADETTSTNPVMQFSFNTPFGAAADAQFGRVLFNDYHVENVSESNSPTYPAECPTLASSSIAQEKMLEYALFDLSSFVIPVVSPTVSIGITTTPLSAIFQEGDTTDAINVNVTNTSSTLALDNTIVLTVSIPTGLTPTAITDSTGGWNCTLNTLTCTRTTSLAPQASDGIVITVSVPGNATGSASSITAPVTATVSSPTFSSNVTSPVTIITVQRHAAVTWATPAPITAGTPLSSTQLDAVGNTAGTYVYTPASGTVLSQGSTTLSVTFTPTDQESYPGTATTTVTQVVNGQTSATVSLTNLAQTYTGSPLPVTVMTSPASLTVGLTYTGTGGTVYGPSSAAPTAPGSYTVVGTINDPDYTGTSSVTLVISKATAPVTLTNLAQTYTGSPLPVTVTTTPTGLTVGLTYTGTGGTTYGPSSTAPTAPGSYTVVGTINDPDYTGTSSVTLVISKATAPVTLTNLAQTYTGSPLPVTVTTTPTGLTVGLTYTGTGGTTYGPSSTAPTAPGSYTVVGTINDPNYTGTTTVTLVISKTTAPVTLTNLAQTYTGSPLPVTATTTPTGLTVGLTYTGTGGTTYGPSSIAPTAPGSYTVVGTINDPDYSGTTTVTLVISKATATVSLTNLLQSYTGSPRAVTVTTTPTGLTVTLTYAGTAGTTYGPSSAAPIDAGSYAVSGTINDPNYTGTGTATLVVSPLPTVITIQSSANPSLSESLVTFTASVSTTEGIPSGNVNFMDGVNVLGTSSLSGGIATFATSSLSVGPHTITAVYLGTSDALPATSGPISQLVLDFTLSSVSSNGSVVNTTPSQLVLPNGTATYPLNITPTSGTILPAPLVLTVTGIPQGAVASISAAPWTQLSANSWSYPANTAFGDFPLTINMPQSLARLDQGRRGQPNSPSALWAALLLPFALVVRRKSKRLGQGIGLMLLLAAGVCATVGLTGCGATSGLFAEQQQSYTITVTATAGTLTHSTQVTLTVE
jgi:hypothetical protein